MGNETGISRQKRPPAAQQPAASQSLTKDGPVSLNPSQDLDDTASGGGTTPDDDTTQSGGTTPDDDTTTPGGGTFDDDDELRHASWCSFGNFGVEDKDKPGSHALHAYPALSEGSYNYYITWKGEKLGVHGEKPEDFATVRESMAGPTSSIGPGFIGDKIAGFTYVGGAMQSYSQSDKCRTTHTLYAPPTTGFLGDYHGPGCTCEGYMKVAEQTNWDDDLQACWLDTDAHIDVETGSTKRLKVGMYTTYYLRREKYDVNFVSLVGDEETILNTVEGVYYEQPLSAVPTADGSTVDLLAYKPDEKDVPQGMQFAGWCLPGDDMEAGVTAPENATMPAGALTLYALWVPVTHTVTFDSNGGTPVASPKRAMRCPWGCSSPWRWQRLAASPRCWCCASAAANKPPNSARKHGKAALHQQGGLVDCRKS